MFSSFINFTKNPGKSDNNSSRSSNIVSHNNNNINSGSRRYNEKNKNAFIAIDPSVKYDISVSSTKNNNNKHDNGFGDGNNKLNSSSKRGALYVAKLLSSPSFSEDNNNNKTDYSSTVVTSRDRTITANYDDNNTIGDKNARSSSNNSIISDKYDPSAILFIHKGLAVHLNPEVLPILSSNPSLIMPLLTSSNINNNGSNLNINKLICDYNLGNANSNFSAIGNNTGSNSLCVYDVLLPDHVAVSSKGVSYYKRSDNNSIIGNEDENNGIIRRVAVISPLLLIGDVIEAIAKTEYSSRPDLSNCKLMRIFNNVNKNNINISNKPDVEIELKKDFKFCSIPFPEDYDLITTNSNTTSSANINTKYNNTANYDNNRGKNSKTYGDKCFLLFKMAYRPAPVISVDNLAVAATAAQPSDHGPSYAGSLPSPVVTSVSSPYSSRYSYLTPSSPFYNNNNNNNNVNNRSSSQVINCNVGTGNINNSISNSSSSSSSIANYMDSSVNNINNSKVISINRPDEEMRNVISSFHSPPPLPPPSPSPALLKIKRSPSDINNISTCNNNIINKNFNKYFDLNNVTAQQLSRSLNANINTNNSGDNNTNNNNNTGDRHRFSSVNTVNTPSSSAAAAVSYRHTSLPSMPLFSYISVTEREKMARENEDKNSKRRDLDRANDRRGNGQSFVALIGSNVGNNNTNVDEGDKVRITLQLLIPNDEKRVLTVNKNDKVSILREIMFGKVRSQRAAEYNNKINGKSIVLERFRYESGNNGGGNNADNDINRDVNDHHRYPSHFSAYPVSPNSFYPNPNPSNYSSNNEAYTSSSSPNYNPYSSHIASSYHCLSPASPLAITPKQYSTLVYENSFINNNGSNNGTNLSTNQASFLPDDLLLFSLYCNDFIIKDENNETFASLKISQKDVLSFRLNKGFVLNYRAKGFNNTTNIKANSRVRLLSEIRSTSPWYVSDSSNNVHFCVKQDNKQPFHDKYNKVDVGGSYKVTSSSNNDINDSYYRYHSSPKLDATSLYNNSNNNNTTTISNSSSSSSVNGGRSSNNNINIKSNGNVSVASKGSSIMNKDLTFNVTAVSDDKSSNNNGIGSSDATNRLILQQQQQQSINYSQIQLSSNTFSSASPDKIDNNKNNSSGVIGINNNAIYTNSAKDQYIPRKSLNDSRLLLSASNDINNNKNNEYLSPLNNNYDNNNVNNFDFKSNNNSNNNDTRVKKVQENSRKNSTSSSVLLLDTTISNSVYDKNYNDDHVNLNNRLNNNVGNVNTHENHEVYKQQGFVTTSALTATNDKTTSPTPSLPSSERPTGYSSQLKRLQIPSHSDINNISNIDKINNNNNNNNNNNVIVNNNNDNINNASDKSLSPRLKLRKLYEEAKASKGSFRSDSGCVKEECKKENNNKISFKDDNKELEDINKRADNISSICDNINNNDNIDDKNSANNSLKTFSKNSSYSSLSFGRKESSNTSSSNKTSFVVGEIDLIKAAAAAAAAANTKADEEGNVTAFNSARNYINNYSCINRSNEDDKKDYNIGMDERGDVNLIKEREKEDEEGEDNDRYYQELHRRYDTVNNTICDNDKSITNQSSSINTVKNDAADGGFRANGGTIRSNLDIAEDERNIKASIIKETSGFLRSVCSGYNSNIIGNHSAITNSNGNNIKENGSLSSSCCGNNNSSKNSDNANITNNNDNNNDNKNILIKFRDPGDEEVLYELKVHRDRMVSDLFNCIINNDDDKEEVDDKSSGGINNILDLYNQYDICCNGNIIPIRMQNDSSSTDSNPPVLLIDAPTFGSVSAFENNNRSGNCGNCCTFTFVPKI